MEIKVDLIFEHLASIFERRTSIEEKKVLTVFESGLDSQAQEEFFQTFDFPITRYRLQVKVKF